jgi:NhaP-type Na+/H+ or K+/H+ antiporter
MLVFSGLDVQRAPMRERLDDPPVEVTLSLLTGYAAYLPAEELGLSCVMAADTVGLYMSTQTARVTNLQSRMQGQAMTWMGMRGAASPAAALAVPMATDAGDPIGERPLTSSSPSR